MPPETKYKGIIVGKWHSIGHNLTGSLAGAYDPQSKVIYMYSYRVPGPLPDWSKTWNLFPSPQNTAATTFTNAAIGFTEALGSLLGDLTRFSKFETNWDNTGAAPFATETMQAARELLAQAFKVAMQPLRQISAPMLSPCSDGRICFTWRTADKELWIYVEAQRADVYRCQPLSSMESESFEQIPISDAQEHIDWVLS